MVSGVGSIRGALRSAFRDESQEALLEQQPSGGRLIIWLALSCVGALLLWASFAQIEEVVRGEGKVIPSQSVQIVQSADGGVVAELLTHEGAPVAKDQPLLRVEAVRAQSQQAEASVRGQALEAQAKRLQAEAQGHAQAPADLAPSEHALFLSRQSELQASLRVLEEQGAQRGQEAREIRLRLETMRTTAALALKEYQVTKPLLASGAVSEIEVLRLERESVRLQGEVDALGAQLQRAQGAIAESHQRRSELTEAFRSKARQELASVNAELAVLEKSQLALDDRVVKTVLRAPVTGVVKTMHVKSVGAVLASGKDVIEIVPRDDSLLIEARIAPRDIAQLRLGQSAAVRFSAYDSAVHGSLRGTIEHISADTVTDERNASFYVVRVRTATASEALEAQALGSKSKPILPGMTASIDVLGAERSVLTYLIKPLVRAKEKAFTER
jgi:adhesin transport system membrane fusion protein